MADDKGEQEEGKGREKKNKKKNMEDATKLRPFLGLKMPIKCSLTLTTSSMRSLEMTAASSCLFCSAATILPSHSSASSLSSIGASSASSRFDASGLRLNPCSLKADLMSSLVSDMAARSASASSLARSKLWESSNSSVAFSSLRSTKTDSRKNGTKVGKRGKRGTTRAERADLGLDIKSGRKKGRMRRSRASKTHRMLKTIFLFVY